MADCHSGKSLGLKAEVQKWSDMSRLKNGPSRFCRVDPELMHEYWIASPILESKMVNIGDTVCFGCWGVICEHTSL